MPKYVEVNGSVIEFPDDMSTADVEKAIRANAMNIKPAKQPEAAFSLGKAINDIPRQVGLTARYGLEGLADAAQIVTEPIRNAFANLAASTPPELRPSNTQGAQMVPLRQAVTQGLDRAGVPAPQGANERVIGDATRLVAGAGGIGGVARTAAAAPGAIGQVGAFLSQSMPQQLTSAAGAGLAGGASREAGGTPLMQAGASLVGGGAGGQVPGLIRSTTQGIRNTLAPLTQQDIDVRITEILRGQNVDYSALPLAARSALREEVGRAMRTGGELNPDAVRRLADFRAVGATPTRSMVTLDPVDVTRERNLAKIGANSTDQNLNLLPRLENQNNATFIRNLDRAGALEGDPFRAGEQAIGSIAGRDRTLQAGVNSLYERMRGMAGGDLPLDRKPFVDNIYGSLQRENRMAFFPKELSDTINQISSGNTPFTPQTVDMLKTMMATASRSSTDGNVRAAISIAREALENTPVSLPSVGPGLATGAQAQVLRGATAQADEVLGAMNQARQAAAQRFAWQESARPIEAALNGAQPDNFVRQFVINGSLDDARAVAQNAPLNEVKNAILSHLKDKALNNATSEVGKFSQSAYNSAIKSIGDRKLALFFSPEELVQLRALGRAASYAQVQPVGSAVNNSNSGALLLGKGYDALMGLADRVPVVGPMLVPPVRNIELSLRNRQVQNLAPGLLNPTQRPPASAGLLLPSAAAAGLLTAP